MSIAHLQDPSFDMFPLSTTLSMKSMSSSSPGLTSRMHLVPSDLSVRVWVFWRAIFSPLGPIIRPWEWRRLKSCTTSSAFCEVDLL